MTQMTDELKLYREVASMTGEIIYKYIIADDIMEMYKSDNIKSSAGTIINDYADMLKKRSIVEWERSNVGEFIEALISGEKGFFQQDIKVQLDTSFERWYHVVGKTIYDDNNKPESVIGKFSLIDRNADTTNNATDRLTGLLKSYEFKKQLQFKSQELAGLIGGFAVISVIDTRKSADFETEQLLKNAFVIIASKLKELFGYNALVARIKKDEFAVAYYGNNITTEFLSKIEEFKENISNMECMGLEGCPVHICGGVYCGPLDLEDPYRAMDKASMAMLFSRYRTSNTISMYSKDIEDAFYNYSTENRRMKSAEIKLEHKLVQNTLKVLAESSDFNRAVNEMLGIAGEEFYLDKISVYEIDSANNNILTNYCWEKETAIGNDNLILGVDEKKINWINDSETTISVNDYSKLQSDHELFGMVAGRTKSFATVGYRCSGIKGCICFEKYNQKHKWNEMEINTLELMGRLMSSCLINVRLYNEILNEATNKSRIDFLTSLYKYNVFLEEANKYIATHENEKLAVVSVKLDGFIRINQSYGYDAGDSVLREYAKVLINHKDYFIMGGRVNADNLVFLVKQFDERGRMISEATVEVLYNDFVKEMGTKYPAAPLSTKAGVCKVDADGRGIAEYIEIADRIKSK